MTLILFLGCNDEEEMKFNENNYLIFGHFYGMCFGEGCVETYKLTDSKLYEDSNDNYSGNEAFSFNELAKDKFDRVKDLIDYFPIELLSEENSIFGCPDCADQGGLFIQYIQNGDVKSWRIDQSQEHVPDYLHNFMDKVNEKIYLINN